MSGLIAIWNGPHQGPAITEVIDTSTDQMESIIRAVAGGKPFWIVSKEQLDAIEKDLGDNFWYWQIDEEQMGKPDGVGSYEV